jgi:DNA repair protein RecO (recombination protein O)
MYQGSSLLLDFFTKDYGKLRLIARGARSSKTSLQMFQCLSISFKGKGDLKSLSQWEISDEPRRLMGNDLVMAIYVNELIQRLLPEGEEHSEIFKSYWSYIKNINTLDSVAKEYSLRVFENQLLQDLGYGLDFDDDINGNIINNNLQYDYIEDQGFTVNDEGVISGSMLLHLSNSNESITNPNELSILKKMNRKRLKSLLGDKPLKSKELFFVD